MTDDGPFGGRTRFLVRSRLDSQVHVEDKKMELQPNSKWLKLYLLKLYLFSAGALSFSSVIMPLSSDQVTALKNPDTKIMFQDQNPKKGGMRSAKNAHRLERRQLLGQTGQI